MLVQLLKNVDLNAKMALVAFTMLVSASASPALAAPVTAGSDANPGIMLTVQVQTPEGKAVTNVSVVWTEPQVSAVLKSTKIEGGGQRLLTDSQGHFTFKWTGENFGLMVACDQGFGLAQSRDLTNRPVLVVQPWGRISGVRTDHNRPLPNHHLSLGFIGRGVDPHVSNLIDLDDEATTDSNGHFTFEHVPPVEIWLQDVQTWLGANTKRSPGSARLQEIDMQPGETYQMEIATQGRTVVGRIELGQGLADIVDLKSLDGSFGRGLDIDGVDLANRPWVPAEFDTADQRAKWYHDYYNNTENGRQRQLAITRTRSVMIHSDGSFVSEMVEPGKYVFSGNLFRDGRIIALLELHFVVPPDRAEIEDAVPLDVGKAILTPVIKLKAGDLAPDFTVPSLDGQTIKLSDYAGKYVLLDFWATWCGPCVAETPNLKSTFDAFGADKRFAMVSLSCDFDRSAPAKYVKANGISWAQAFLDHNGGKDVVNNYGVTSIPQILLIGPDRKIIACDLRGSKIKSVVATALGNR